MDKSKNKVNKPKRNWAVRAVAIAWIVAFMMLLPVSAERAAYSYYSNPVKYSERTGIGVMNSEYVVEWANGKYDETYYVQKATELKESLAWFIGVPCVIIIALILVVPGDDGSEDTIKDSTIKE